MNNIKDEKFKPFTSETLEYRDGKLFMANSDISFKCLKVIGNRYKIFVDYGFKGNARYADDKSDYYVVDTKDNTLLKPLDYKFKTIVSSLEEKFDNETPIELKIAPFVTDTRVFTLTLQNLINDGWVFSELENGDLKVKNKEEQQEKVFKDEQKFEAWIFSESKNY
ncbi:hypothetical protein CN384_07665 [Bacillus thuringiensis]|uniref:hypothetical protein n=1 Tax=Bacillus cereus group TaxID=86661 RepID=UPI000BF9FB13|nr:MULTISPECIES: hypothetical protein [Bacillus cereus group]PES55162.1 hypothetical protein CN515_03640 [Bacillus cereus]PFA29563.1 hypothetical protein CN384_07665 [Bacillus thuringiensis]